MLAVNFFSVLKDIVLTLTAVTGSYVALKGLNTWKRQISGQANHSLSKNLLVSLFKYRDAIESVRNPFMTITSDSLPEESKRLTMNANEIHFYSICKIYNLRWQNVSEIQSQVYANLTEAEAIWGNELSAMWKTVRGKVIELQISLDEYLDSKNPKSAYSEKEISLEEHKRTRAIIYGGGSNDAFKTEFESELEQMVFYIRTKLQD